jgi:hypothetical protein
VVEVTFEGYPAEDVTFVLDRNEAAELSRRAKELGVPPSTLLHMWIKERLNQSANGS